MTEESREALGMLFVLSWVLISYCVTDYWDSMRKTTDANYLHRKEEEEEAEGGGQTSTVTTSLRSKSAAHQPSNILTCLALLIPATYLAMWTVWIYLLEDESKTLANQLDPHCKSMLT